MELINMQIAKARETVRSNVSRIAKLGEWPAYIDGERSLVGRIPEMTGTAPGFDAGIACALDLIPRDKQKLAATLHAAYTQEAVEQVRLEMSRSIYDHDDSVSESAWWLAACSLCQEAGVDTATFLRQLSEFAALAKKPMQLELTASAELKRMRASFRLEKYSFGTVPIGTRDGCIQAAYIAGHPFGVLCATEIELYFVGTYLPSLGLESFSWSDAKDGQGRAKSGPVHGSKQFVKCADTIELIEVMQVVCKNLG